MKQYYWIIRIKTNWGSGLTWCMLERHLGYRGQVLESSLKGK